MDDYEDDLDNIAAAEGLCDRYPDHLISAGTIWTKDRNLITWASSHDDLVGELLCMLVGLSAPASDVEREAIQRLHDVLSIRSAAAGTNQPIAGSDE
jgi:hypothetical protein